MSMTNKMDWIRVLFECSEQPVPSYAWSERLVKMGSKLNDTHLSQTWETVVKEHAMKGFMGSHSEQSAQMQEPGEVMCRLIKLLDQMDRQVGGVYEKLPECYDPYYKGNTIVHALMSLPLVGLYVGNLEQRYVKVVQQVCEKNAHLLKERNAYGLTPLDLCIEMLNPLAGRVLLEYIPMNPVRKEPSWDSSDAGASLMRLSLGLLGSAKGTDLQAEHGVFEKMLNVYARYDQELKHHDSTHMPFAHWWQKQLDGWVQQWVQKDKKSILISSAGVVPDMRVHWLQALCEQGADQKTQQVVGWMQAYANVWGASAGLKMPPVQCIESTITQWGGFSEAKSVQIVPVTGKKARVHLYEQDDPYEEEDDAVECTTEAWVEQGQLKSIQEVRHIVCKKWDELIGVLPLDPKIRVQLFALTNRWKEQIKLSKATQGHAGDPKQVGSLSKFRL